MAAPSEGWKSDPFVLTGQNGYLYGRGVTDDKGPVMSVAFAAASLLSKRQLDVDLVFLIEGEEECGSLGFEKAVKAHKVRSYVGCVCVCANDAGFIGYDWRYRRDSC